MSESNAETLGHLVRAARHAHGLATPALAQAVGVNQSSIVRLENGRFAKPTPAVLQRISEVLEIPLMQLYALADIPMPALQPYLRASYGLSHEDVENVHQYIQQLAARYGADGTGPLDGADEQPERN